MAARKYIQLLTKEIVILAEGCIKKGDIATLREIDQELSFRKRKASINLKKKINHFLQDTECKKPSITGESIEEFLD